MTTKANAREFTPDGPLQPAPGVIWPVEQWVSFGAEVWDMDRRCVVCGGDLYKYDHTRCIPSAEAGGYPPTWIRVGAGPVEEGNPRNPRNSTESAELTDTDFVELSSRRNLRQLRALIDLAHRLGWNGVENSKALADFYANHDAELQQRIRDLTRLKEDAALIDALEANRLVVQFVDIGGEVRWYVPGGGKWGGEHFPSWRAAASAGLARAGIR